MKPNSVLKLKNALWASAGDALISGKPLPLLTAEC
jgi:hypothetical protein